MTKDIRLWKGQAASGPSPADNFCNYRNQPDDVLDPDDDDLPEGVDPVELERARWIQRQSTDWQRGVPPLWQGASPGRLRAASHTRRGGCQPGPMRSRPPAAG
jgi:hypothetical protein